MVKSKEQEAEEDRIKRKKKKRLSSIKPRDQRNYVPIPLDGGYGWIIVICAMYLQFTAVSGITTFGLFLVEWIDYYNVTKLSVSWIVSANLGIWAIVGKL